MNSNIYTYSVTSIANILSDFLNDDELALLAATFTQLGDTLATIAILRTSSSSNSKDLDSISNLQTIENRNL